MSKEQTLPANVREQIEREVKLAIEIRNTVSPLTDKHKQSVIDMVLPFAIRGAEIALENQQKVRYTFYKDDEFIGVGGFLQGSMNNKEPQIVFNLEAFLHAYKDADKDAIAVNVRESLCEVLTHEFAHSIQEYLNLELSEPVVDRILANYKNEWATREEQPDSHTPMVDANSVVEFYEQILKSENIEQIHSMINNVLPSLKSWAYTGDNPTK